MDPFVRRLVERLMDPAAPLSRNRHFQTFENPEGKLALRISRRLRALATDLETCVMSGGVVSLRRLVDDEAFEKIELRVEVGRSRRLTRMDPAELEMLKAMPGLHADVASKLQEELAPPRQEEEPRQGFIRRRLRR